MSKFYIEARLPAELEEKILTFQRKNPNNELPNRIKPHITVKASLGLIENMKWLDPVSQICAKTKPFCVTIDKVGTFGEIDVVYLNAVSEEIKKLHRDIVDLFDYPKEQSLAFFERELYSPHISLGVKWDGLSQEELVQLKADAESEFDSLPVFQVDRLVLLKKVNGIWIDDRTFPLGGS